MVCYAVIDTNVLVSALLSSHDDAYLVTGNIRHFPEKPFIVTANEFLEILNNGHHYGL